MNENQKRELELCVSHASLGTQVDIKYLYRFEKTTSLLTQGLWSDG